MRIGGAQQLVISYGEHADGIVTTARRNEAAANSDQVLVASSGRLRWSARSLVFGHARRSAGYILRAEGEPDQILKAL